MNDIDESLSFGLFCRFVALLGNTKSKGITQFNCELLSIND